MLASMKTEEAFDISTVQYCKLKIENVPDTLGLGKGRARAVFLEAVYRYY